MSAWVDRTNPAPLHFQVRRGLISLIKEMKLKPGDQLPSETVLGERFRVSRQTLRQAVESLVRENILYKRRPHGTFVGFGAVESDLQTLRSAWEDFRRLGMEPKVKILSLKTIKNAEIASALGILPQKEILELTRVFATQRQPVSYDTVYFALPDFAWLKEEKLDQSWYELMEKRGIRVSHARAVIDAQPATKEIAGHLNVPPGSALLRLRRQTYSNDEQLVAFSSAFYRSDRYQFSVVLSRR